MALLPKLRRENDVEWRMKMDRRQLLAFEISIADFVESVQPTTVESLEDLSDTLHQHLEVAMQDYANDKGWADEYSPAY